ncbi:PaaI family thioesterase [Arsenicicoccus dermatophilus]|uniref:PaaI family thioesterase n=1 Tax=Arsenicicoccus dermatophilus TaxID=1076331 RepID=UPI001F4D22F8|nr:PaaI family thioesterase [Arsenicicoccus dermatophilus]MCH8614074.1 PaaI family thioesterase [Arsenicicoccus dermatophilus]
MANFMDTLGVTAGDPHETGRPGDDAGLRVTPTEAHANVNGGVHGGLLATMLDSAMGQAARDHLPDDKSAVTVSLTVTYLNGAKVGEELLASAEVRKEGGSLIMLEADVVRVEDDEPVAHGVATFSVIDAD